MFSKIHMLMVFIIITILYIFSDTYFMFFLFWFYFLVIVFLLVTLMLQKNKLDFSIIVSEALPKKMKQPLIVKVKNSSLLPIINAKCSFVISNQLTKEIKMEELYFSINAKTEKEIPLDFINQYSGKVNFKIETITYYDFFRVFSTTVKSNITSEAYILPNIYHANLNFYSLESKQYENLEIFANQHGNTSEYTGLKEYRPGDDTKQIHWKLSSKLDEIILKEVSEPVTSSHLILIESTYLKDQGKLSPKVIDTMLETYLSIAESLIKNENIVSIAFKESELSKLRVVQVESIEHVESLITTLLTLDFYQSETTVMEEFIALSTNIYSHLYYVTSNNQTLSNHHTGIENLFILTCVEKSRGRKPEDHKHIFISSECVEKDLSELAI